MKALILTLFVLVGWQANATNLAKDYKKQLQAIEKVQGRGNNKLFFLMTNTGKELAKDWSPELAKELARVFNSLLDVNQNSFLVELLNPVLKERKKEFTPILNDALSPKNKKVYEEMKKRNADEAKNGNG